MRITGALVLCLLVLAAAPLAAGGNDQYRYTYYLLTENAEKAQAVVREAVRAARGYVQSLSSTQLVLRVPAGALADLKAALTRAGYITDEQVYRTDVTATVTDIATRLAVKQKLLDDLYKLFAASEFHQTLEVEQEIDKVVVEIEKLKGQLAWHRDRAALCEITVHLNQKGPADPARRGETRWQWIRDLGVPGMMEAWR